MSQQTKYGAKICLRGTKWDIIIILFLVAGTVAGNKIQSNKLCKLSLVLIIEKGFHTFSFIIF